VFKPVLATRQSPLALVQAAAVAAHLRARLGCETELLKLVTTGDRQTDWSLEQRGGKGLFTGELEAALLRGEADFAVHSAKDLPGAMPAGLTVVGYLPRADARDILILRQGITEPVTVATGSPRRRGQLARLYPAAQFTGIRGNVDTRLRKISDDGLADATVLAAAGLARLGLGTWPGLTFVTLEYTQMVPAVGQGAIAVQCRVADAAKYATIFDAPTARAVNLERAFQSALGGGCQTALGVHATADALYFFHENIGGRSLPLSSDDLNAPAATAARVLTQLGLIL
jgi:hydroxymethylbilane synthase